MTHERLSFLQRLSMAFDAFRRILGDDDFAQRLKPLLDIARSDGEGRTIGADFTESSPNAALQLLSLLQQHGRLVDFLEEEVTSFSDQEVGAAARVVHEGCRDVLRDYLTVAPVREEAEGSRVQIEAGFDPSAVRLIWDMEAYLSYDEITISLE